jgi:fatty acid desaturase
MNSATRDHAPSVENADLRAAYLIVQDLFKPSPWLFWRELILTGTLAWSLFAVTVATWGTPWLTALLLPAAALAWYRGLVLIHELTHQSHGEIPYFHLAWNLVFGVASGLPSVLYEQVHLGHHRKSTYGTDLDPEYLPLAGRPWMIVGYLCFAFVAFPLLLLRFLVLAPLSWICPPLRSVILRFASSYAINPFFSRTLSRAERRNMVIWEGVMLMVWWPLLVYGWKSEIAWHGLLCAYLMFSLLTFINRLRMLHAHEFVSEGKPLSHLEQFRDSIDTTGHWWTELWAPLGLRYHAVHHLFPTLPFHNLSVAYHRLRQQLAPNSCYRSEPRTGFAATLRSLWSGKARPLSTNRPETL